MRFERKDFDKLLSLLKGFPILTLEESHDLTHGHIVNFRHDVDDNLPASMQFAALERAYNIRSTFFILDTSPYWNDIDLKSMLRTIVSLGHNLGWHNNAITRHLTTGKPLEDCIREPLNVLRQIAPVTGTAGHGDPLCHQRGYLNYYAFGSGKKHEKFPNTEVGGRFALSYFGLAYEAYHTGHTHYISDSGGEWQQDNEKVIADFRKNGGKLQILIHPQHWAL